MVVVSENGKEHVIKIKDKEKVKDILIRLGFNPEEYIGFKDEEVIDEETKIGNEENLRIVKIVSGG